MRQSVRNFERSSSLLLRRCQSVGVLPWLLVCCFVWGGTGHAYAQSPQQFTGVGVDGVTSAITAFKAAIGGSDNGTSLGSSATGPWADGTSVFGATATGLRWGFAEGRVGGPDNFHTFIRVFNWTFNKSADVTVTYLKSDGTTVVQRLTVPGPNVNGGLTKTFVTIDANSIAGLDGQSFGTLIESTNGVPIVAERSMYWDSNGVFWAGGLATAGTRLP